MATCVLSDTVVKSCLKLGLMDLEETMQPIQYFYLHLFKLKLIYPTDSGEKPQMHKRYLTNKSNIYTHECTFKMFSLPFQSTADSQNFEIYERLSIR